MSWFVVSTHPHKETLAIENLRRQGYAVYCPWVNKRRSHARKIEIVKRPLFPGYLFVSLNEGKSDWHSIRSTAGVRELIRFGLVPAFLPKGFIAELRRKEEEGVIPLDPMSSSFANGSRVRIISGALKDAVATVLSCDDQSRVVVLLDFLKRTVKTQLPFEAVESY